MGAKRINDKTPDLKKIVVRNLFEKMDAGYRK